MKSLAATLTALTFATLTACSGANEVDATQSQPVQSGLLNADELVIEDDRETLVDVLDACREGGNKQGSYHTPSEQAQSQVERALTAFAKTHEVVVPESFVAYEVGSLVVLCEASNHGGGAIVLRADARSEAIIEVPHSFHDLDTLDVGVVLFSRLGARALLVNTAHRYRGAGCQKPAHDDHTDACESDMTRSDSSLFLAAHRGLVAGAEDAVAIQVHGFAPRAHDPDVIVSNANTSTCVTPVADSLNERLPNHLTFEYPEDIHELGGTLGAQAKHMQAANKRMMHLELSRRLRSELGRDAALAASFSTAVSVGLSRATCGA